MEESVQFAKKYLEDVLSFFGVNIEVEALSRDGEVIELNIPSTQLNGFLIGQQGDTMRALQFLVGSALKNQGHTLSRVSVDVADYKKQRAERLIVKAEAWITSAKNGETVALEPMNAVDRRTIHQLAADNGLVSESAGEGRDRHVVLKPAA